MQKQGIVKPSSSPWASPVVLVPKKDGSTRFCVDYRRLNRVTKKDIHPLPQIDDILDTLAQANYFTTLDLSAGYWQVELDPTSQPKTAFGPTVASMNLHTCRLGSVTRLLLSSGICK